MELIPYKQFGKLRLKQFAPPAEILEAPDCECEWMGGYWKSESIAQTQTHMERHEDTPKETGGLEVDFSDTPESAALAILDAIRLPLRHGMTLREVRSVLGVPETVDVFVADRKSYNFTIGTQYPYRVSATVHETDGLIFVTVIRKDVLRRCDG